MNSRTKHGHTKPGLAPFLADALTIAAVDSEIAKKTKTKNKNKNKTKQKKTKKKKKNNKKKKKKKQWGHYAQAAVCAIVHYENMPIQIYWKFHYQKNENFQIKTSDIFHVSTQNVDCRYSLEPPRRGGSNEYPQFMFLAEIRQIM